MSEFEDQGSSDDEPVVEEPDALDDLHDSLFGPSDLAPGKRYERLVAVIFGTLGERVVRYDVRESGPGRRTKHQIDVWIEREGREQLVVVECKHWKEDVGKGVLDTLVGIRNQLEAAKAIAVTTVGFTKGARDVAFDEGIDLVLMTRFRDPEDWSGLVKEIRMSGTTRYSSADDPVFRAVDPEEAQQLPEEDQEFGPLTSEDRLLDGTGAPRESLGELIDSIKPAQAPGEYSRAVDLPDDRYLELPSGYRISVRSLEWTETVSEATTNHIIGPRSDPQLLVRQISPETGEPTDKRAVFDHQLRRWRIDEEGTLRAV